MKNFKEFLSESITINGDFNGTLNVGGSSQETPAESYFADVVWEGKIYRMEIEGSMPSKNELAEQLQGEYPGAIVQNIYKSQNSGSGIKVIDDKRYHPAKLDWV